MTQFAASCHAAYASLRLALLNLRLKSRCLEDSARLTALARRLQEAHDKQRRNSQRLETQYHVLRQSTRNLERQWSLYRSKLENELGIPHWQADLPELSPVRTNLGTMEASPTRPTQQDQHRGRTGERPRRYHGPLLSGNMQHQGSTSPVKASANKPVVEPRSPLMNPNPSPFVSTFYPREPFIATGPQHQQQQPGHPEKIALRSQSAEPTQIISPEQLYAIHNQTSHSAPQQSASNTHRPSTPEPRCVVPPSPHPHRGIRYQPPQPATPVHDSPPPVPPIPMQHVRRQIPDAQGRPENLTLLDVSDRRDVRVYSPQGPYSYSP
ncbi:MAG: hypothetical protein L6R37_002115 [Teloschistes peruensis]|nr:MAG: hypothetical protein L6R37_002115 [Teloschistes peruensis]